MANDPSSTACEPSSTVRDPSSPPPTSAAPNTSNDSHQDHHTSREHLLNGMGRNHLAGTWSTSAPSVADPLEQALSKLNDEGMERKRQRKSKRLNGSK